jgi:hypothetical protein
MWNRLDRYTAAYGVVCGIVWAVAAIVVWPSESFLLLFGGWSVGWSTAPRAFRRLASQRLSRSTSAPDEPAQRPHGPSLIAVDEIEQLRARVAQLERVFDSVEEDAVRCLERAEAVEARLVAVLALCDEADVRAAYGLYVTDVRAAATGWRCGLLRAAAKPYAATSTRPARAGCQSCHPASIRRSVAQQPAVPRPTPSAPLCACSWRAP